MKLFFAIPHAHRILAIPASAAVFLASFTGASADIPAKPPLSRYTGLWANSPFTSKPPPPPPGETVNPLDDFTLTGIAPVPGGYRITIISKKNPEMKKVIEPGRTGEFSVVSVMRDPDKMLGTSVVLSTGSMQGTVTFEPEMLALKAAPEAPQPPNGQNLPPGVNPEQVNQPPDPNAPVQRQPRPRIVVPPPVPTQPNVPRGNGQNRSVRRR